MKNLKGLSIITCVTILTLFIACTSQAIVIYPFLYSMNNSIQLILILVSLNYLIFMVLINYFLTCKTDPGSVPNQWVPRQQAFIEVKKSTHTLRYCKTCKNYKPPRTHHCSCCNRCVLKMDHHCPWVDNCIGFANYCHFFRFLIYVDLCTIYLFTLLSCRLAQIIRDMHHYHIYPTTLEAIFISINMILTAAIMISVGILTIYHIYCITTNTTTIEGWEKGRSLTIKGMGKIHNVKCPYDQGIYKNIQSVLGKYPIFWFLPRPMSGTGLDFPISTKYLDEEVENSTTLTTEKLHNTSTISLNRYSSNASSQWALSSSVIDMSSSAIDVIPPPLAYNTMNEGYYYCQATKIDHTAPSPILLNDINTYSVNTIIEDKSIHHPITAVSNTPESTLTFASTATTLVDHYHHFSSIVKP
ncbi:DHHC palmitoyltransferase-domain-containing protein [Cokeromyces recurvatus]|uniref:DHHC palmitoyltransferase-domain-containing protein n=1 Tax=Cokeromyces recurvatus TaxID=90255 RepID=UPI00221ED160|nr:DHHC palmitoyltransferase-domain-containing protein [Cokeromyces recurvatus]KAI7901721.1 DHHC palmitoyltransferase-domain-containing protein [Cokeromyces recurvatus]